MKPTVPFIAVVALIAGHAAGQAVQVAAGEPTLKPADFNYMLRGYFLAGSNVKDTAAPGGFYESPNRPKILSRFEYAPEGILIRAFPGESRPFADEYEGFRVVVVNGTNARQKFAASDSRISVVQEAQNERGLWKPVEYLPSSWCGNSYHDVFLKPREYWEFTAPRYTGTFETKLRFALRLDDGSAVYSNEFHGSVNPEQFTVEQGHTPTEVMDPYAN